MTTERWEDHVDVIGEDIWPNTAYNYKPTQNKKRKNNKPLERKLLGWNRDQLPIILQRISNYRNKWQEHTKIVLN